MADDQPQGNDSEDQAIAARIAALESSPADDTPTADVPETEEEMPASNQEDAEQDSEEQDSPEDDAADTPEGEDEAVDEGDEELELPEGVSERTRKQWEKMQEKRAADKAEIARLKGQQPEAKKDTPPAGTSVFDNLIPGQAEVPANAKHLADAENYANLDQNRVNQIAQQFMYKDPDTGETSVDAQGLVNALLVENQKAVATGRREAMKVVEKYEQTRQVEEAHSKHPYLDPNNKEAFDPNFFNLVRVRMLDNFVNGSKETLNQAAEAIKTLYTPKGVANPAKAADDAVKKYKASQETRRKAAPIARNTSKARGNTAADVETLRSQTRSGNARQSDAAIVERLRRAGL